jgi:2-oxo-4-hydroxy-4-carboxy-5-ureidoimidazoline decarboxylase
MPGQPRLSIAAVNGMDDAAFVAAFGDVAEASPWVAAAVAGRRPFAHREAMIEAFGKAIDDADTERATALCRAHPDLAGRAVIAGGLSPDSRQEQASAGLDRLSPAEFERFTAMNRAYRARHGIPFIFAVRDAGKHDILAAFEDRLHNPTDAEIQLAIGQIQRIIRSRLEERVLP